MSGGVACRCEEKKKPVRERAWRITKFRHNTSAFNGYHRTSSDYSTVRCQRCHGIWRTKAAYTDIVPIQTEQELRQLARQYTRGSMIIFLQNAWSPVYAGGDWPRRSWLRALATSPSGRRLRLLTDDLGVVHNCTPIVGKDPKSVIQPDEKHIKAILKSTAPRVVVACGALPETALRLWWRGPLLCLPHPAYRVLTNALYERGKRLLEEGFAGQMALRQRKGGVEVEAFS